MEPTRFILIRHAIFQGAGGFLPGRAPGYGLGAEGRADAEALAGLLAGEDLAVVACGPLERARQTAAPIAARHGLTPRVLDDLDEIALGDWTGRAIAELHGEADWRAYNAIRALDAPPGGEGIAEAAARATRLLRLLRTEFPGRTVAVVSHADVLKAAIMTAIGMPLDLLMRLEIACASRSVLRVGDGFAELTALNLPPR